MNTIWIIAAMVICMLTTLMHLVMLYNIIFEPSFLKRYKEQLTPGKYLITLYYLLVIATMIYVVWHKFEKLF